MNPFWFGGSFFRWHGHVFIRTFNTFYKRACWFATNFGGSCGTTSPNTLYWSYTLLTASNLKCSFFGSCGWFNLLCHLRCVTRTQKGFGWNSHLYRNSAHYNSTFASFFAFLDVYGVLNRFLLRLGFTVTDTVKTLSILCSLFVTTC